MENRHHLTVKTVLRSNKEIGMTAKNDQLMKLVESIVRKEVARIAPTIIRETMTRVMGNMILEAADSLEASSPTPTVNSNKRRALQENTVTYENDEWPTMGGETMTSLTGLRGATPARAANPNRVTMDSAMTEHGNVVPLNPSEVPEHLDKIFNHDYSNLMKSGYIKGNE